MNLAVADPVHVLGVPTAFGLWYQVMCISLAGRNFPLAQGANQVGLRDHRPILLK
jgi:hypothetical protein